MLILGIDTGTAACAAAVYDTEREKFTARYEINNRLTHSVTLAPMVENMLFACGCTLSDIGLVAVSVGPGSFTGIRIGVSYAKGLCFGKNIPCAGVTACEAAAYAAGESCGTVLAAIDAKVGGLYCALFRADGEKLERLTEERCVSLQEAVALIEKYSDERTVVTGDGAAVLAKAADLGKNVTVKPIGAVQSSACGVCLAALHTAAQPAEKIMPLYIQLPQAQRELEQRLKTGKE